MSDPFATPVTTEPSTTAPASRKKSGSGVVRERKLPSKIWVGSLVFPIKIVPRGHDVFRVEEDNPAEDINHTDGVTVFDMPDRGIFIVNDMELRETLETVWHEVTHAVNHVGGLDEDIDEEDICGKHGILWTQVLLDNPRLQAWITWATNTVRKQRAAP